MSENPYQLLRVILAKDKAALAELAEIMPDYGPMSGGAKLLLARIEACIASEPSPWATPTVQPFLEPPGIAYDPSPVQPGMAPNRDKSDAERCAPVPEPTPATIPASMKKELRGFFGRAADDDGADDVILALSPEEMVRAATSYLLGDPWPAARIGKFIVATGARPGEI